MREKEFTNGLHRSTKSCAPTAIGRKPTDTAINARIDLAKRTVFDPYCKALKELEEKYGIKTVLAVEIKKYRTPRSN